MHGGSGQVGRPRSEQARAAVLQAVDDMLLEVGYAAMTMKGIAERAGVSRMTVYRWWSTKAEILFEASAADAQEELAISLQGCVLDDLVTYLESLTRFLTRSPAGAAYRALLGEAQHDAAVADLLTSYDVLGETAREVVEQALRRECASLPVDQATALLVGPTFFWITSGRGPAGFAPREFAEAFLHGIRRSIRA